MSYDDNEERAMVTRSEYWGFFGLVCIGLFIFLFFYKHLCMTIVEFVLLLLCIDRIGVWFSLPAT